MSLFDISAAIAMLLVAGALLVWFYRSKVAASLRRRTAMMARVGLDPDDSLRSSALMDGVRKRCSRCPSEALCERWLAGEVEGDNMFCPNSEIFDALGKEKRLSV